MTRQYWSNHEKVKGLNTSNSYIAGLIIRNFQDPEIPLMEHEPYRRWKKWIAENPIRKPRDK